MTKLTKNGHLATKLPEGVGDRRSAHCALQRAVHFIDRRRLNGETTSSRRELVRRLVKTRELRDGGGGVVVDVDVGTRHLKKIHARRRRVAASEKEIRRSAHDDSRRKRRRRLLAAAAAATYRTVNFYSDRLASKRIAKNVAFAAVSNARLRRRFEVEFGARDDESAGNVHEKYVRYESL